MSLAIILIYFVIVLGTFYTYRHKSFKVLDILKLIRFRADCPKYPQSSYSKIPGPFALPLIGTKWIFFWKHELSKLHEYYNEMYRTYGDVVLEVGFNGFPVVSLYNKDDIEKVLKFPSKFPFRPPTEIIALYRKSRPDRYASTGITNTQGEEWHFLRTKLTPHIQHRATLAAFTVFLNEICDDFIELIKHKRNADNVVEDFHGVSHLFALESMCSLVLGRRMGFLNKDETKNRKFEELSKAVKNIFILQRDSYYGLGLWKYFPTKTWLNYSKNEDMCYNIISEIVEAGLADNDANAYDGIKSIFSSIINTEGLDIREKKSGIIDLITGGIQLISHTLSFNCHYLSSNPTCQNKLFEELLHIDLSDNTKDHSKSSLYAKCCIQETFRMTPAAFCLARILEEDFVVSGHKLKAGTVVLCHTMVASLNEETFKDASRYKPERWMEHMQDPINKSLPGSAIVQPFGIGKRICPGKKFVGMELGTIVSKLVKEFEIKYVSPFELSFEFVLAPKGPVNVRFSDRN